MSLRAGFAEVDISPTSFPVRTYWAPVNAVIDPLFAHAAVFQNGDSMIAFLSLDIVIIEKEYVEAIREQVSRSCAIPAANIMVCATHNHACPAVVDRPWSAKDADYLKELVALGAQTVIKAFQALGPVELGTGRGYEGRVSFNRRFILKNGSVISQPAKAIVERDVLFAEGMIDPEIGVVCVKDLSGKITGLLVNFACHAVHLMGSLSAGFPGHLCNLLKAAYGNDVVCVFLNGACGNVIHGNYSDPGYVDNKEHIGSILAGDVQKIVESIQYSPKAEIGAASTKVKVRYRAIDGLEENLGNMTKFNVFPGLITRGWYSWSLAKLKEIHAKSNHEEVEIQVLRIGEAVFGAIPAEYFSQHALRIKEQSAAPRTFVVSLANGWLGYIPHREAFDRIGGHESTWCISSKMEPEAGDLMADAMLELVGRIWNGTASA